MENITKAVFALNSLIEINNKRAKYYASLMRGFHDGELLVLFDKNARQSQSFAEALTQWRSHYRKDTNAETRFTTFNFAWEKLVNMFNFSKRRDAVSESEQIDNATIRMYRTAVSLSFLPPETLIDIQCQIDELENALIRVKRIAARRETLTPAKSVGAPVLN